MLPSLTRLLDMDEEYQLLSEFEFDLDCEEENSVGNGEPRQLDAMASEEDKEDYHPHLPKVYNIVVRDIRRSYADMFVNVANSLDMRLTERFFKSFSVDEIVYDQKVQNNNERYDVPHHLQINGLPVFLQFWYNRMFMYPDAVYSVSDIKITSRRDSPNSSVSCVFDFSGTHIYDMPHDLLIPSEQQSQKLIALSCRRRGRKRKRIANVAKIPRQFVHLQTEILMNTLLAQQESGLAYDTDVVDRITIAPLLSEPVEMLVRGSIVMQLNEHKAITHLNFDCHFLCDEEGSGRDTKVSRSVSI